MFSNFHFLLKLLIAVRIRIRAVQMDDLRGLLGPKCMDNGVVWSDERGR